MITKLKIYSLQMSSAGQNQSLLCNIKKDCEFKVFYNKDGEYLSVSLFNEYLTIKDAIIESAQKFNYQRHLDFILDPALYEIYGAKKSGKKKDDLPAFEKSQLLGQTCLKNFYLMPIYFSPKLHSKDSSKSIETQISLEAKPKNQISQSSLFGCLCLRKGSLA